MRHLIIGPLRDISVGHLSLGSGSDEEDEREESSHVHLSCTGCPIRRTFKKGEIPDRFRGGCPNCSSLLKVDWTEEP